MSNEAKEVFVPFQKGSRPVEKWENVGNQRRSPYAQFDKVPTIIISNTSSIYLSEAAFSHLGCCPYVSFMISNLGGLRVAATVKDDPNAYTVSMATNTSTPRVVITWLAQALQINTRKMEADGVRAWAFRATPSEEALTISIHDSPKQVIYKAATKGFSWLRNPEER